MVIVLGPLNTINPCIPIIGAQGFPYSLSLYKTRASVLEGSLYVRKIYNIFTYAIHQVC